MSDDEKSDATDDVKEVKAEAKDEGQTEKNKLYVGNLPFSIDNAKLAEAFSGVDGVEVVEAVVITDKFNEGRSKGFGFVTVAGEAQAEKAIEAMNGQDVDGRKIVVNIARPRVERRDSDRGGFNRSY